MRLRESSTVTGLDDRKKDGVTKRTALTVKMVQTVRSHDSTLVVSALQKYTFARNRTENSGAESQLEIFDGDGKLVFQGSEFQSGIAGYWRPSGVLASPGSTREKTWGRHSLPGFVG